MQHFKNSKDGIQTYKKSQNLIWLNIRKWKDFCNNEIDYLPGDLFEDFKNLNEVSLEII